MALETDLGTANDLVGTEEIIAFAMAYNHPLMVADAVAWTFDAPRGSTPVRVPAIGSFAIPAGAVSESADMTRVEFTTDSTSGTPAVVGVELAVTDQIVAGSHVPRVTEIAVENAINALRARRDSDLQALMATATTNASTLATALTRAVAKAAINQAQAQFGVNGALIAFLLPNSGYNSLSVDELTATATSAQRMEMFGANSAFLGEWHGAMLFRAPQAPASAPGYVGAITPMGAGVSGLGIAQAEDLRVEINRGAEGARARKTFAAISSWYAVLVTKQANLLGVRMA